MKPEPVPTIQEVVEDQDFIDWEKEYYYINEPQYSEAYELELLNSSRVD